MANAITTKVRGKFLYKTFLCHGVIPFFDVNKNTKTKVVDISEESISSLGSGMHREMKMPPGLVENEVGISIGTYTQFPMRGSNLIVKIRQILNCMKG